ncbi:MAG: class I SAM-dependent methyltransferase [Halioglobus sp.]|nr:class I SAM-dependent methyltransferase [Halioglobus sp.]
MAADSANEAPDAAAQDGSKAAVCLACGSDFCESWASATDIEYCTTTQEFTYFHCLDCDCLWIDPVPVDALDTIYPENYYSYVNKTDSLISDIKSVLDKRFFRPILREIDSTKLRVLDVGGGSGGSLDLIREIDARVNETVIVDLDAGARAVALQQGHRFFHGPIEDFSLDDRFDMIIMLNLIEHVQYPCDVLQKARQLLAPGGRLVVKTPNWRSYDQFLFRYHSWGGFHCPRHWVLWTLPGFTEFARSCGLEVVSGKYTQGAPFWAISILDALRRKGVVSISQARPAYRHPLFGILSGVFAVFDSLRKPFAPPSQMFFVLKPMH